MLGKCREVYLLAGNLIPKEAARRYEVGVEDRTLALRCIHVRLDGIQRELAHLRGKLEIAVHRAVHRREHRDRRALRRCGEDRFERIVEVVNLRLAPSRQVASLLLLEEPTEDRGPDAVECLAERPRVPPTVVAGESLVRRQDALAARGRERNSMPPTEWLELPLEVKLCLYQNGT